MGIEDKPAVTQSQRQAVLEELAKFLRQKNMPVDKHWSFLDRPIFITLTSALIGGLLVGGITARWQTSEQQRAAEIAYERALVSNKFELIRTFSAAYQKSGNALNNWLVYVLRLGEEQRDKLKQNSKRIGSLKAEITQAQEEYRNAAAVDGILAQIEAIFASAEVRTRALNMKKQWLEFEELMRDANREYESRESLTSDQITKLNSARSAIVSKLENQKNELLTMMGDEIRAGR